MRNISELDEAFNDYIEKLKKNLVIAQDHSTDVMFDEVKDRIEIPLEARNIEQFLAYEDSLKEQKTRIENDSLISSVYSNLLVGGVSRWSNVPVGAFLEWGTGPLGEGSNEYPHGFSYTTEEPWDLHTYAQFKEIGTWGITARPHLYPSLLVTKNIHLMNIKEAIEDSWKN